MTKYILMVEEEDELYGDGMIDTVIAYFDTLEEAHAEILECIEAETHSLSEFTIWKAETIDISHLGIGEETGL